MRAPPGAAGPAPPSPGGARFFRRLPSSDLRGGEIPYSPKSLRADCLRPHRAGHAETAPDSSGAARDGEGKWLTSLDIARQRLGEGCGRRGRAGKFFHCTGPGHSVTLALMVAPTLPAGGKRRRRAGEATGPGGLARFADAGAPYRTGRPLAAISSGLAPARWDGDQDDGSTRLPSFIPPESLF